MLMTMPPLNPSGADPFDADAAWAAVTARDRRQDGRFVMGVLSTGIYCRPSCPARRPRRENVRFFADGAGARSAGLRPCFRCRPDDVARDEAAVAAAVEQLRRGPAALSELARAAGYSPAHFQRLFARIVGLSPAAYARALRRERAAALLNPDAGRVADAIYDAGYSAPSRFYADAGERLGMAPSAWRDGGRGETIRWAMARTTLGPLLIAATARGVCRVAFGEGADDLARRFPGARLQPGGEDFGALASAVVAQVERPAAVHAIPLDVQGTAFQEAVWRELRRIPPGETRTYAQIAAAIGRPGAVRAAGTANGANSVAVLIPCHRVIRADGSTGGYAWGEEIKRELLRREAGD